MMMGDEHLEVLDQILEGFVPNYRSLLADEFWGKLSKVKYVSTV